MYKGTTPIFVFTFEPEFDPSTAQSVILTFSSNKINAILEKNKSQLTIDSTSIAVRLTQEETLKLPAGRIYCQINFTFSDGSRVSTDITAIEINSNLHNKVIQ